jgi:hypothetical protein
LAKAENVPPYIIFSDKSLNDMVTLLPTTNTNFLDVSGVGQFYLLMIGTPLYFHFWNYIFKLCEKKLNVLGNIFLHLIPIIILSLLACLLIPAKGTYYFCILLFAVQLISSVVWLRKQHYANIE